MNVARAIPLGLRLWFGVLGAPFAWTAQFLGGYALTEAACNAAGSRWGIALDGLTLAITAVGALVAVLAGVAAVRVFRETKHAAGEGGAEESPPLGRIHFLATVGMAITPLFLAIILMGGLGSLFLDNCHQG